MEYQKTAEATGNEATDAVPKLQNGTIMKFQKICNKIILKQLQMRMIKKIPQGRYIPPEEIRKTTENVRLM